MNTFIADMIFIGKGLFVTLQLLIGSLAIGLMIGICFSVLRHQGIATTIINRLISITRGTPLILQLSLVYFGIPGITGIKLSVIAAGILSLGINSAAYIAEILRAGIESLPKGQFEAARTLRIPTYYIWKDIILIQVIKNVLPAIVNETIALLKETALIATIGGMDIMRRGETLAAEQFTYFMPLCMAGAFYYGPVLLIEYVGKKLEQRGSYAKN